MGKNIYEIKKYERKKGSNTYHYRINMSKKNYEELGSKVYILSSDEYNNLKNEIEGLKNKEFVRKTEITNLKNELKGLKYGNGKHEKLIKSFEDLFKKLSSTYQK